MSKNRHVAQLVAARRQVVLLRRFLADGLGSPFRRASCDQRLAEQRMEQFIVIQQAINGIDEAIRDERDMVPQTDQTAVAAGLPLNGGDAT